MKNVLALVGLTAVVVIVYLIIKHPLHVIATSTFIVASDVLFSGSRR